MGALQPEWGRHAKLGEIRSRCLVRAEVAPLNEAKRELSEWCGRNAEEIG